MCYAIVQNNVAMFRRPQREKCSHSTLISPLFLHMLSEYEELLCKFPFSVQMREKSSHQKKLRTRTLSTQWSGFVVHKLKFDFVATLTDKFISLV